MEKHDDRPRTGFSGARRRRRYGLGQPQITVLGMPVTVWQADTGHDGRR
jgi:hypothetical protein